VRTLEAIGHTSRSAAPEVSVFGADVTASAVGAVEGAIEIARDPTVSAKEPPPRLLPATSRTAGEIGETAAPPVKAAVRGRTTA